MYTKSVVFEVGISGGMALRDGKDASGRQGKVCVSFFVFFLLLCILYLSTVGLVVSQGKGVYQYVDKYGANVDGYRFVDAVVYLRFHYRMTWNLYIYIFS